MKLKKFFMRLKEDFKLRGIDYYLVLIAAALCFINLFTYPSAPIGMYNPLVTILFVIGIVLFVIFSLFNETLTLAKIAMLVFPFAGLLGIARADNTIDYFTTHFYEGFTIEKIFTIDFPILFAIIVMFLSFILATISLYIPQKNKKQNTLSNTEGK